MRSESKAALRGEMAVNTLQTSQPWQGICTGGEIAAVSTYITEVGPKRSLARSMALIGITANAGFLLAQLASYLTREAVGVTAMENWAWRIPFIIAIIPGAVAAQTAFARVSGYLSALDSEHVYLLI